MKREDLEKFKSTILGWITSAGGGSGPFAPSPHDLNSAHHTGNITDAQHGTRTQANAHAHSHLSGVTADQHHNQQHTLATNAGLGADHTISGAVAGYVLRASSAIAAAFAQLQHSDLGGVTEDQHHARQHALSSASDHIGTLTEAQLPTTVILESDASATTPSLVSLLASAVGALLTYARADHSHQLDQSIAPTWTGNHTFRADLVTRHIKPETGEMYDIGLAENRYRTGRFAELAATLFSKEEIMILGDALIIAKGAGTLGFEMTSIQTAYNFETAMTVDDWLLIKAENDIGLPGVEWIKINTVTPDTAWTSRISAADNAWRSIAWSPELGLFAAVATTGSGSRVMTSPDGINWTIRTSAANNQWLSIVWSPGLGLFAAVANSGTGDRVMTSPDGINWTIRTSASDNNWRSITWSPGLGLFAAVSNTGTGDRVMTSPDGINWTSRTSAADNNWFAVDWSPELGLFAAVANSGTGNRVMTSPDGINWTIRTSAANNSWVSVAWSPALGLFAAVSVSGTGNRVMTSPDGINWTIRTSAADNDWNAVAWSPELGLFAAVSSTGTGNRVMTSPDGINWTIRASSVDNNWFAVAWSPKLGLFAAVANTGINDRVMTGIFVYTCGITRNVDGSGANAWTEGTPFVVIGQEGDYRIELEANGAPSIKLICQGATWNATKNHVTIDSQGHSVLVTTSLKTPQEGYKFLTAAGTMIGQLSAYLSGVDLEFSHPGYDGNVKLHATSDNSHNASVLQTATASILPAGTVVASTEHAASSSRKIASITHSADEHITTVAGISTPVNHADPLGPLLSWPGLRMLWHGSGHNGADATSSLLDRSGANHHLAPVNSPYDTSFVSGLFPPINSTDFNGTNQYFTRANEAAFNDANYLDIIAIVKFDTLAVGAIRTVYDNGATTYSWRLYGFNSAGSLFAIFETVSTGGVVSQVFVPIALGKWQVIRAQFVAGSLFAVTANGDKQTATAGANMRAPSGNFELGAMAGANFLDGQFFAGGIAVTGAGDATYDAAFASLRNYLNV